MQLRELSTSGAPGQIWVYGSVPDKRGHSVLAQNLAGQPRFLSTLSGSEAILILRLRPL